METTTDLKLVRQNPKCFTWGHVVKIHDVGEDYTFVEYVDYADGQTVSAFHVYVKGQSSGRSSCSWDKALVLAISIKNNSYSMADDVAFCAGRVLGLDESY